MSLAKFLNKVGKHLIFQLRQIRSHEFFPYFLRSCRLSVSKKGKKGKKNDKLLIKGGYKPPIFAFFQN